MRKRRKEGKGRREGEKEGERNGGREGLRIVQELESKASVLEFQ